MKCEAGLVVLYVVAGFITGAVNYDNIEISENCIACSTARGDRMLGSVLGGVFWPIYWGSYGSIQAVRYAKTQYKQSSLLCRDDKGNMWKPTAEGYCVIPPSVRPLAQGQPVCPTVCPLPQQPGMMTLPGTMQNN